MQTGPDIARIAALIGDRARAAMLLCLMDGRAFTATELSRAAQITKQTASSHLAKMVDAQLIVANSVGRHRYFALADHEVAGALEQLITLAHRIDAVKVKTGPTDEIARKARVCYDHLAGEIAVGLFDSLKAQRLIRVTGNSIALTEHGALYLQSRAIDIAALKQSRRPLCLACLDWSVRRHHMAGEIGAAILDHCLKHEWARRRKGSRAVIFSAIGERALRKQFGMDVA
ncbi:MAG: helix-turn-helix domain-containing protein [Gemmatimonadaceae bacterium]